MRPDVDATPLVDLLAQVLARHTPPGEGHVVFSESDFEERLRDALKSRVSPGDELEQLVRRISNQLAHSPIKLAHHGSRGSKFVFECKNIAIRHEELAEQWCNLLRFCSKDYEVVIVDRCSSGAQALVTTNYDDLLEKAIELVRQDKNEVSEATVAVTEAFVEGLASTGDLLGKLDPIEAKRLGEAAVDLVIASARWSQFVGDRLDTTQVTDLLGVSRQALAKRQASGSLVGLPGHGTTWYPAWQFDLVEQEIRPEVREIIGTFRDRLVNVDPFVVASWASTPQPDDLDGMTPAQWLTTGGSVDQLRRAAARAASRLAS